MHGNKVNNQITKKLWIIKPFWNIYHFKDLNIKKNGLIFRIRIKNASRYDSWLKNPQKGSPNWTKTQTQTWYFPITDWPKFLAQPSDFLIKIKPIFFNFLEIRMHFNLYLISFSIPTSINKGNKSELGALLFWLFNSPYVKDVLKAFALRTSFL